MSFKIVVKVIRGNNRYVIVNDNGAVLDDAQGWGYTTTATASKALWYKFKGGDSVVKGYKKFWNDHPDVRKYLNDLYESNIKEICRDEISEGDLIKEAEDKYSVSIPKGSLKYL